MSREPLFATSPGMLVRNILFVAVMIGLGLTAKWLHGLYGNSVFLLGIFAIVTHQVWHRWRHGEWFGEDAFVVEGDGADPTGCPKASSLKDSD